MRIQDTDTGVLTRQSQQGDVEAFTVLVQRYQAMALGYAFAQLEDFDLQRIAERLAAAHTGGH